MNLIEELEKAAWTERKRYLEAVSKSERFAIECGEQLGRMQRERDEADKERDEARERLASIARIIESVDNRCAAADGPVTPTLREMKQAELSRIYKFAKGKRKR